MTLVRGEEYAIGVGVENPAARGTAVTPQDWVRSREPGTIEEVVEKVDIKETKATGVATQGSVVTMKKVEGELPLNLRFRTIGYFLKSLLGGVSSATEAGETTVYRHTITLDRTVLQPTLTIAQARGDFDHKNLAGAVVSKLNLSFPVDDMINGAVTLKARSEVTTTDFTPTWGSTDHLAPHQMVTLKIADNVAGLNAASGTCVTNLTIDLDRASREKLCIASASPVDFIAQLLAVTGTFTHEKTDDTFKNLASANTSKAIQISVVNTAQTIGTAANPTLTFTLPNCTFTTKENRSLEDVVSEEVTFMAHYDDTEAKAITVSLVNQKANYNHT